MQDEKKGREAVDAASHPEIAFLRSRAIITYPVPPIGSTEYAARIIAARFALSPVIAREIAALNGMGARP